MTVDYMQLLTLVIIGLLLLLLPWVLVWYQLRELEAAKESYNTMERLLLDSLMIEINKTKADDTGEVEDG